MIQSKKYGTYSFIGDSGDFACTGLSSEEKEYVVFINAPYRIEEYGNMIEDLMESNDICAIHIERVIQ